MIDRKNRVFTDEDVQSIANIYREWKKKESKYEDIKGYCKSAPLVEIEKHKYVLTPGRYVGIPDEEDDGIPYEEKVAKLTRDLKNQIEESQRLDNEIKEQLSKIGIDL